MALHLCECPVPSHEWRPARQHLHMGLSAYVGPRAFTHVNQIVGHSGPRALVGGHRDTVPVDSAYGPDHAILGRSSAGK